MTFTQPCFIRKNTAELRKKLEELGYEPTRIIFDNERLCIATAVNGEYAKYTNITNEMFDSTNPHETWNCAGRIDCGTNEDLFLALAALREDTDKGQWFCANEYNWSRRFFICKYDTIKEHINMVTDGDCGSFEDGCREEIDYFWDVDFYNKEHNYPQNYDSASDTYTDYYEVVKISPAYNLQDVLDKLPVFYKEFGLYILKCQDAWIVKYQNIFLCKEKVSYKSANLIDAAYQMLCCVLKDKEV